MRNRRPMGKILLDLEKLLREMTDEDQHAMQFGDVLALVFMWMQIHAPQAREIYTDGTSPEFYYGPKDG